MTGFIAPSTYCDSILVFQVVFSTGVSLWLFDGDPWLDLLLRVVFLAVVAEIYLHILQKPFRELVLENKKAWLGLCAVSLSDCLFIVCYWTRPVYLLRRELREILVFVAVWLLLYCGQIIMTRSLFYMSRLSRARQTEMQRNLLLSQVEAQRELTEAARRARHDLRHHDMLIAELAKKGDTAAILDYLGESGQAAGAVSFCENDTVSHILSVYSKKAAESGIKTEIRAQVRKELVVSNADLVAILANILENAVHGCEQSEAEQPFIKVDIHEKSGKLVIRCENSAQPKLRFSGELPQSLRGVGTESIRQSASRYEGICDFSAGGGVFTCGVLLNPPSGAKLEG